MAVVLLQVLERAELNKLPKGVQNKLEKFITELQNANEALKTQHERFKADSEQQYFDIDKRLAESREQIVSVTRDLHALKDENKKLTEELNTLKGIEGESTEEKLPQQQTKAKYEIEAEKRELARLLEKRTQEVENLTEDVKRLNEKLSETSKVKMELQFKLDNIQSSEASVQHRENRMVQEKELLEKKIEWLTEELKNKTEELINTSRVKGEEILKLSSNLKTSTEQVASLESQLASLRESCESQNKRAEDLNNKLKQARDAQSSMEEKYRNELNAHVKLSSLYKVSATDLERKNQELSRAVEELSKMVKDTGEANKALEVKATEGEEVKNRLEAELREKIKKMEKELENAAVKAAGKRCCGPSLTEENLESMCPSAAAIAAIVKPGMKFFDLYNAYVECQTQLQLEKQETKRVSRVLDEIVQEVESKAPVLKRQREEYESMQRSMTSLCNKLEQARTEIYNLQKEKEEGRQNCETLEKEKAKIERQLEDTSSQLCTLLLELEEARGHKVTKDDGSSSNISSTSEVTTPASHLSFRSVEDLQRQNQNLLRRVRDLEEEKDKQQGQVTTARVLELEANVAKLQEEVEQLKEQRNQQKQLADSSARQRDMYKALLTQSTGFSLPPPGPDPPSQPNIRPSVPATRATPQRAAAAESAQSSQAKAALKQLNDAFTLYKKEKAENDKMLNETNDKLQQQLTELRSSHAKLTSQLEFGSKRYEMQQETVSAYRREISALQDRSQKMAVLIQQHEHVIHTMSQDLRQANEKLALEEVRVQNLTKERDMLRQAESRLSREKEAMLAEQRNQNLLLTNIKSIQLTMERTETDTRQQLNNKIERLEAELASLKTRLDQEVAQRHALGRSMDGQLLEAKKQLETQNTLQQKTRELLRTSEQQVAALKAQLASASSSEAASSTPVIRTASLRAPLRVRSPVPTTPQQSSQLEQELGEVKGLLRSADEQNSELSEQLKNANTSVEQYRAVVLTLEDSLKKEKESRSPLELRLKESEEVQKQLENRILEVEKAKQQDQEQRRKAMNDVEKQVCELQRSLKVCQTEQQEALERAASAVTLEQKAIQDSLLQTKLAAEAQAKYERELMLHAADVEALQQLKKAVGHEAAQKRELEEKVNKTCSLLQEKTTAWNALEKHLKEDLANVTRRCGEVEKQNSLLHQQMDEMASRSRQAQQQQLDVSFSEEGKTTEQILEILRFVRREKEIAMTRCEASEEETLRHKQRTEHQKQEIMEIQEALNAEREKMQATTKTLAQQQEQLKKMETFSALQETNKLLKMDRDKLEQELQQAQARVTKLQSDISPLHHSMSLLSEKNGSLQADKRILEEDIKRWKAKTQQLMSQQKDGDVEEKQKMAAEKEAQQKRISQLIEELAKLKTEVSRCNASSNSAQNQVQGFRDSLARLTSERDKLKKDLEANNLEMQEKNKTITQVKKIGRRYKSQYEELKVQHDKLVEEKAAKAGSEATPSQDVQQELSKAQEELSKMREELNKLKEEGQKKQTEAQKVQHELEEAQKENQLTKDKLQEVQTQMQSQLTQTQTQLQQSQNQLTQSQKELQQAKTHSQQLKSLGQGRQNQIQQLQRDLQQAKESLQQNLTSQKELQQTHQSHSQEVSSLKNALSQTESQVTELQDNVDGLRTTVADREAEIKSLQEQLTEANKAKEALQAAQSSQSSQADQAADVRAAGDSSQTLQEELTKLRQELSEGKSREEHLKQQINEKEEKTKKVFMGAKTRISQLTSSKEKLRQEVEELKQVKEELEVRMSALKSQFEGRLLRQDRELRELRGQAHTEPREELQDQSVAKAGEQARPTDQRQKTLKSPAQERGSSSLSEPPTANIRPTPSTPSPSNKPSPSAGSKATPRASIRPMVTPATVAVPTPTATVMPTTQTDSQEVLMSTGASVHSTSSTPAGTPTSASQPSLTQATAFVQPTQQHAANQEALPSMEAERPSTSSSVTGPGSKRSREEGEEEEENRPESSQTPPTTKKLRLKPTMALQMEAIEDLEGELRDDDDQQDSPDDSQDVPEECFPMLAEDEERTEDGVSQSVPSDHVASQGAVAVGAAQDVIVIETDSDSRESKDREETQQDDRDEDEEEEEEEEEEEDEEEEEEEQEEEEDEEYNEGEKDDDDDDEDEDEAGDSGTQGGEEDSNEESRGTEDDREEKEPPETSEENSQPPSEPLHSGEGGAASEAESLREPAHLTPTTVSSSSSVLSPYTSPLTAITSRLPHPRRPPHPLPPRLYIQPPAAELGPPHTQRQPSQLRRQSVGRGPQLTPGIGTMQHFFDDDDRMVPSTPTLVVPHRTDGFAEAIHSPQVAGLSTRFRFGPPEDLLPQASASHSDLGQLASQGGLGMYESPLFLAAHDEDGGGRSVPTTPLQVAAPVTVFTESLPSDSGDNMASQSVPMVTASSTMASADDGDEVFMDAEGEGPGMDSSLDTQTHMESSVQQSEDSSLPSTSQEPDTSSLPPRRLLTTQPLSSSSSSSSSRGARGARGEARMLLSRRGAYARGGRGAATSRGGLP